MKRGDPLSPHELECVRLMCEGKRSVAIGMAMGLSDHTVRCHIYHAEKKMGAATAVELAVKAVRLRLI